jgi:hypothetical protein
LTVLDFCAHAQRCRRTEFNVSIALSFSEAFGVEQQDACLRCLELLLSGSDLPRHTEHLQELCNHISPEALALLLNRVWPTIPPQDYERLSLVCSLRLKNDPDVQRRHIRALEILSSFHASQEVSERVPFHALLSDPWCVLEPLLTIESCSRLLPLSGALGLDADLFPVHLVRNIVAQHCSAWGAKL